MSLCIRVFRLCLVFESDAAAARRSVRRAQEWMKG